MSMIELMQEELLLVSGGKGGQNNGKRGAGNSEVDADEAGDAAGSTHEPHDAALDDDEADGDNFQEGTNQ